jgi:hypothetical protein
MKKQAVILMLFLSGLMSAQTSINQYQYVIVPSQFNFLKEKEEYRLNTLTKMLLEKYGFKAFLNSEELPAEILDSNCNKLYADVLSSGNFIQTKLQVVLKDCKNKIVYQSAIGISKEKVYKTAYTQALRAAFQSFETLEYQYNSKPKTEIIQKAATVESMSVAINHSIEKEEEILYAQPISNGFQLVDASPKVVMKIFKTSNPTTFSALKGTIHGVLLSRDNNWFFEYYQDEKLISEKINVKF